MSKKLAQMAEDYVKLRHEKARHKDEIGAIEAEMDELSIEFKAFLDREESQRVTVRGWTIYKSEGVIPIVKDYDAFWKFAKKEGDHMIERRPSVTACRELFATKGKIPGLEPFTRVNINVKKG